MNIKSVVSAVALASAVVAPTFIASALGVSALTASAVSFAQQSNGPVTRAQVRAELVRFEKAGWRPAMGMGNSPDYPAGIQAAEARVAAQNGGMGSYGGGVSDSSASGSPAAVRAGTN